MRSSVIALLILLLLALSPGTVTAGENDGLLNSPWPIIGGDVFNTGRSNYNGSSVGNIKWQISISGAGSPVVGKNGIVYLPVYYNNSDARVQAIDPANGRTIWTYTFPYGRSLPGLAIGASNIVYVTYKDSGGYSRVAALNPQGQLQWLSPRFTGGVGTPLLGPEEMLYISDNETYSVDPRDRGASKKWTANVRSIGRPVIGSDGIIYIAGLSGNCYALNATDGSIRWSKKYGNYNLRSETFDPGNNVLYASSYNGDIYKIETASGNLIWTYSIGVNNSYPQLAVGSDGTIYAGCANIKKLYAIDANGNLKWEYQANGNIGSPSLGSDGTIYFGSSDGVLHALNPDGTRKWALFVGDSVTQPIAVGEDETLYVVTNSKLLAVGPDLHVTSLTSNPASVNLICGESVQLEITANYSDGSIKDVTGSASYEAENENVGVSNGLITGLVKGSATVIVSYGGQMCSIPVSVNAPAPLEVASVKTKPERLIITAGHTQNLRVTALYNDGSSKDVTADSNYQLTDTTVAQVDSNGLVAGMSPGGTNIVVTYEGKTRSVPVLVVTNESANGGLSDSPWPVDGADVFNSGRSNYNGSPVGNLLWQKLVNPPYGTAVGNNAIYVLIGNYVKAFNRRDGSLLWEYELQEPGNVTHGWLSLGTDGKIYAAYVKYYSGYVSFTDFYMKVLDSQGQFQWGYHYDGNLYLTGPPLVGSDGTVYFQTGSRKIFALKPGGELKWENNINGTTQMVMGKNSNLYVGGPSGNLYAVDCVSGVLDWSVTLGNETINDLVFCPRYSTIYAGSRDGYVYSVDPANWNVKWAFYTGYPYENTAHLALEGDGTIYVGCRGVPKLYALNPDGSIKWSYQADRDIDYSPSVGADGTIYLGERGGKVVALAPSGMLEWELSLGHTFDKRPIIGRNILYVIGNDKLSAIGQAIPELTAIAVSPESLTLASGESAQLTVTARYSDGSTQDVTRAASYRSDNISIATVSNDGLVTGLSQGIANISVTYEGQTATIPVTVNAPVVDSISVKPSSVNVPAGRTQQLTVTAIMSNGTTQDVTDSAAYQSGDASIARVSNSGLVTGKAQGNTNVTVTYQDKTATVPVTVTAPVVEYITAEPKPVALTEGQTQQLTVTARYSDGTTVDVTSLAQYQSENASVATVSASGLITGVSPGNTNVTMTYGGQTATVPVTVTELTPVLESISVSPGEVNLPVGRTQQLTITAHLSNGTTQDVTGSAGYIVENASVVSVSGSGLITAQAQGSTSITVTYQGKTATVSVTVTAPVVESISVTPALVDLPAGRTQQLTVTATLSNGTTQDVTNSAIYSSNNSAVATVSASGLVTANAQGSATVTVSYDGKTATVSVTVTAPVVESISVTPASVNIPAGRTQQLTVTAHLSSGTTQDVTGSATYNIHNSAIATVNNSGLVTGKTQGAATVTVTYQGKTATVPVTVTVPEVESISVAPSSVNLPAGRTQQLTVMAHYSDGSTQDVTGSAGYVSGNSSVAMVSAAGLVTGKTPGSTGITVSYGGKTAAVLVTVTEAVLESITVQPGSVTLNAGESSQLTVTVHLSDGTTRDVTAQAAYSSANPGVAAVTNNGQITGVSAGTANVTATFSGKSATVSVTVTAPPPEQTTITVQPGSLTLYKGSSQRLEVLENYSDGNSLDVTSYATFSSSDPSVARVDLLGLVTGVNEGNATITVTCKGQTLTVPVTVSPPTVTGPSRPGTGNPPVVNPPGTRPGTGNPGTVNPPASRPGTGTGTVTPPAERPPGGEITVPPATRPPGGDTDLVNSERPEQEEPTVVRKTRSTSSGVRAS